MISFEPSEDQKLIVGTVADLAKSTIAPRAREFEKARGVADDVRRAAHELGLSLAAVPEAARRAGPRPGHRGDDQRGARLRRSCDAVRPAWLRRVSRGVQELGSGRAGEGAHRAVRRHEHARPFGAVAWSETKPNRERAGFATSAKQVSGGWELNGTKAFVGNAELADHFVVFAQVDAARRLGRHRRVRREEGQPGPSRRSARHKTLGLDCGELRRDHARRRQGRARPRASRARGDFTAALRALLREVLADRRGARGRASRAGVRRDARVRRHSQGLRQADRPLPGRRLHARGSRHRRRERARPRCARAAWAWDAGAAERHGACCTPRTPSPTRTRSRCAAATTRVQLHGGAGFMRDVIVEKLMRDAKQIALAARPPSRWISSPRAVELGLPSTPRSSCPRPKPRPSSPEPRCKETRTMIDFALSTQQRMLKEALHDIGKNVIRPQSLAWDRAKDIDREFLRNFYMMRQAHARRREPAWDDFNEGPKQPRPEQARADQPHRVPSAPRSSRGATRRSSSACRARASAVRRCAARGTPEQKERFFGVFQDMSDGPALGRLRPHRAGRRQRRRRHPHELPQGRQRTGS